MGTAVSDIIGQAYRDGNFVAVGETPTVEEQAEAVPVLRNLLSSLFGFELGEQYRDWFAPSNYDVRAPLRVPLTPTGINEPSGDSWAFPISNVRLIVTAASATTIYFPSAPCDGARMAYVVGAGSVGIVTLNGNGRRIEGAASVVAVAADTFDGRKWFYRADLADWIRIDAAIDEDADLPLPEEFDDLFVTGLVVRLAPRFQVEVDKNTLARFTDMLDRAKKRYKQTENMPTTTEPMQTFSSTFRSEI